jgi:hypothetical protein
MIKSLTALQYLACWERLLLFCPDLLQVEARDTAALAKADRLDIRPVVRNCSQQVWPNFVASCLRDSESGVTIREARLVTSRR